ncbi:conserved hypothetical protein [Clostridium perfringens D str. JGS1721]|uniref:Thoeris protein ThsB TIR-like domain-containing protein n=1 Tax=Clostridium perfringens D str. JGS1721 TaxID=488537 RepID=B1V370_CLOPF|nr:TIR domain-containing protein [Clostridium perfringens]EDT69997.1 conserved hypothetical protein [Clostridium perfringens D str. JGS1721]EDT70717.1 conserved hypothetical protein [Clostridium perfringens D str. JGS1721]EDT71732.1 conserved hypothetical protein [Clostridium perfringens D str. JGS1721]EDT71750.1 conserved hypothetical protein [Clostridium perfringens D str. JGS1721]MDU7550155.1 TIR domain-containing protein [Clostridium perfringens]
MNIFISYKHLEYDVYYVDDISKGLPKVIDYVIWIENKFKNRINYVYKGEQKNEDLSNKNYIYIWEKLKYKIYNTSLTIILISPNMKELYRCERDQWIPWEILYSLKKPLKNGMEINSNAILAIILPNKKNNYDYFSHNKLFRILSKNIKSGYVPMVNWDEFKYNCDYYINKAFKTQKEISNILISTNI